MKDYFDVILIGGGINGSIMAITLAKYGFTVALVDNGSRHKIQDPLINSRTYSLTASSKSMLEVLGLWAELSKVAQPIHNIKISDGSPGNGAQLFFLEFEEQFLQQGPMAYMVEDVHIKSNLHEKIDSNENIKIFESSTVTEINVQPGFTIATLNNEKLLQASLLIGAEGQKSITADYAGIRKTEWEYDQASIVGIVEHELPHHGEAHQFFMPNGPIAILPLKRSRSSFVWTEKKSNAKQFNLLSQKEFLCELEKRFGNYRGRITLLGAKYLFPLSFMIAEKFFGDRVALIGDAAHKIHPIAGQGLNLGLKDVATLAEILIEARRLGQDIGSINLLETYSNWRKFDVLSMGNFTDISNRIFSNNNIALRITRGLGLLAIANKASLRRGIVKEAAGIYGDLPKLMRGISI